MTYGPQTSAGIMLYRHNGDELEVLLAHPGGPFWARKDEGAWSIPKGIYEPAFDDDLLAASRPRVHRRGRHAAPERSLPRPRRGDPARAASWSPPGRSRAISIRRPRTVTTFELEWPRGFRPGPRPIPRSIGSAGSRSRPPVPNQQRAAAAARAAGESAGCQLSAPLSGQAIRDIHDECRPISSTRHALAPAD